MIDSAYNYRTKKHDVFITAPEDFKDYIPQDAASQALYDVYIKTGDSPEEAALEVLKLCYPWRRET